MAVPFIDLRRFEPGFMPRWLERCRELTETTQFVGGPTVAALEERLARESGVAAAVACANGTDALQLALRAVGVGPGDRVLIPDATFWATFEAVVNVGARPVTVDVDRDDLQMDFELFREAVAEVAPKAAILVHLYGWGSSHLAEYRTFCRGRGIHLIEDGAQSFGTTFRGEPIAADAELATISFYPAKVLGACGDAGAVLCSSPALAETVRRLGNHGRTSHYEHGLVGWNSRMDGFSAAFLDLSLDHLAERLASRRRTAEIYRGRLADLPWRQVTAPDGYESNGYLDVQWLEPTRRPAIETALRAAGIGYGTVYPGAMSRQPGAAGYLAGRYGGAVADELARGVLNLPLFAYMTDDEIDEVVAAVRSAAGEAR